MQTSFPVRVVSFWALCLLTVIAVTSTAGPLLRPRPALPRPAPVLEQTLPHVREVPQRMSVIGYEREHFGAWAPAIPEGCPMGNTRDVMLLESFPQESCTPKGLSTTPTTEAQSHHTIRTLTTSFPFPPPGTWELIRGHLSKDARLPTTPPTWSQSPAQRIGRKATSCPQSGCQAAVARDVGTHAGSVTSLTPTTSNSQKQING